MCGMKDRKKEREREAVSVSQRQPSPPHHLLPFEDEEELGSGRSGAFFL